MALYYPSSYLSCVILDEPLPDLANGLLETPEVGRMQHYTSSQHLVRLAWSMNRALNGNRMMSQKSVSSPTWDAIKHTVCRPDI